MVSRRVFVKTKACSGPNPHPPSPKRAKNFFCHWVNLSSARCSDSLAVGDLFHVRPQDHHKCRKVFVVSVDVTEIYVSVRQKLLERCC